MVVTMLYPEASNFTVSIVEKILPGTSAISQNTNLLTGITWYPG